VAVNDRRWFNPSQPQTLQMGVILLYFDAALILIFQTFRAPLFLVVMIAMAAGAFGIANDKKWGYALGVIAAIANLVIPFYYGVSLGDYIRYDPIGLIFSIALVALLLHPMSRDYQRIWFH
jgi:hypothetical protein